MQARHSLHPGSPQSLAHQPLPLLEAIHFSYKLVVNNAAQGKRTVQRAPVTTHHQAQATQLWLRQSNDAPVPSLQPARPPSGQLRFLRFLRHSPKLAARNRIARCLKLACACSAMAAGSTAAACPASPRRCGERCGWSAGRVGQRKARRRAVQQAMTNPLPATVWLAPCSTSSCGPSPKLRSVL